MKKTSDPQQMTLSQFLLFLVIGGIAVIWLLIFVIGPRLRYGDPLYPVENYAQLTTELASNPDILLPDESILPSGDYVSFSAYESSRKKLDPKRDGYSIGVLGKNYAFSVECSPANAPIHLDGVPGNIYAEYTFNSTPVMRANTDYPQLEFIVGDYYYNINAWGSALPNNALDTLLTITENILKKAG